MLDINMFRQLIHHVPYRATGPEPLKLNERARVDFGIQAEFRQELGIYGEVRDTLDEKDAFAESQISRLNTQLLKHLPHGHVCPYDWRDVDSRCVPPHEDDAIRLKGADED